MNIEDRGFILRKVEYGDYDFIITVYTEKFGKTSTIAKNARKSKKRFLGKLEPFNLINFNFKNNGDSESTKILNEANITSDYNNTDLDKNATILCSLVNEYIDAFEINHVQSNSTFLIIENFFSKIDGASLVNILDSVLKFQVTYLSGQGLKPTPEELTRIVGKKVNLSKNEIQKDMESRIKLIRIIAKFSQFHSGKELNSIQYLDLL